MYVIVSELTFVLVILIISRWYRACFLWMFLRASWWEKGGATVDSSLSYRVFWFSFQVLRGCGNFFSRVCKARAAVSFTELRILFRVLFLNFVSRAPRVIGTFVLQPMSTFYKLFRYMCVFCCVWLTWHCVTLCFYYP